MLKKYLVITVCLCVGIGMAACSQGEDTSNHSSSQASSVSAQEDAVSDRSSQLSEASHAKELTVSDTRTDGDISGKVTLMYDDRYLFPDIPAVAGTSQDKLDVGELVADMENVISGIYITSMDVSRERELTQDEITAIISILQNAPIGVYDSLGNPPTGGNYFNLVAYDVSNAVYLRISFNGEWVIFQIENNIRVLVFNGKNSGLEAIRDIIDHAAPSPQSNTFKSANPFSLDPAGNYHLYAYNASLIGYTNLGYAYWTTHQVSQPQLEAAIAAINALPVLEKSEAKPDGSAAYGLMAVDGSYAKTQFFLYDNFLTVNDSAYRISSEQYNSLKAVMEAGAATSDPVPHWFVYMNPNRITSIVCTSENGEMREMKKDNIGFAADELRSINVNGVKTYRPGSKSLESSPFKAVYTFDNGATYTVYVSDTTERVNNVAFYIESSDMSYACEYTTSGYISNYAQATQGMIDGPANPRTM